MPQKGFCQFNTYVRTSGQTLSYCTIDFTSGFGYSRPMVSTLYWSSSFSQYRVNEYCQSFQAPGICKLPECSGELPSLEAGDSSIFVCSSSSSFSMIASAS